MRSTFRKNNLLLYVSGSTVCAMSQTVTEASVTGCQNAADKEKCVSERILVDTATSGPPGELTRMISGAHMVYADMLDVYAEIT